MTSIRAGAGGLLVNGSPGNLERPPAGRESYDDRQIEKPFLMCWACGAWHYRMRPICVRCEGV